MNRELTFKLLKIAGIVAAVAFAIYAIVMIVESALVLFVIIVRAKGDISAKNAIGSTWVSEEGSLEFVVQENLDGIGTIQVGDETVEVKLDLDNHTGFIYIYLLDDPQEGQEKEYLECWEVEDRKKTAVTLEVRETTYYEVGQTIVINRIEE